GILRARLRHRHRLHRLRVRAGGGAGAPAKGRERLLPGRPGDPLVGGVLQPGGHGDQRAHGDQRSRHGVRRGPVDDPARDRLLHRAHRHRHLPAAALLPRRDRHGVRAAGAALRQRGAALRVAPLPGDPHAGGRGEDLRDGAAAGRGGGDPRVAEHRGHRHLHAALQLLRGIAGGGVGGRGAALHLRGGRRCRALGAGGAGAGRVGWHRGRSAAGRQAAHPAPRRRLRRSQVAADGARGRRLPHHGQPWRGPPDRAAPPGRALAGRRAQGADRLGRHRPGPVRPLPADRRRALRVLPGGRLHAAGLRVPALRGGAPAHGGARAGGGGDPGGGHVVVAQRPGRRLGARHLPAAHGARRRGAPAGRGEAIHPVLGRGDDRGVACLPVGRVGDAAGGDRAADRVVHLWRAAGRVPAGAGFEAGGGARRGARHGGCRRGDGGAVGAAAVRGDAQGDRHPVVRPAGLGRNRRGGVGVGAAAPSVPGPAL
ncbi:MAG: sodium/iodide co-transporter, partial [uncultured Gemmatimonadetes bacterium]